MGVLLNAWYRVTISTAQLPLNPQQKIASSLIAISLDQLFNRSTLNTCRDATDDLLI